MTPKQIIQKWVEAFNQGDADQIAEFYHPDAINHQVANHPIQGKEAIRKMFAEELAAAEMTCIVENIFEDGDWAILEWKDPLGLRGCGFFQILDGKIMFQRGYWDKLSFLRMHNMSIPQK
ncbi:nuclear transport factor 2 family protein [Marinifilum fragile]|uniref:nuclear transport factor 2 family protein n=1 Tax=Marinifilum fragile TaxID=570161 RepID=UPI002AA6EC21|nr:nuclear transport factor 2 family protein [Marinifilum fragile]